MSLIVTGSDWPGLMRAKIMSDVRCEQRGRTMGVSCGLGESATLSVTMNAETVR
jgi:hypothetical protein